MNLPIYNMPSGEMFLPQLAKGLQIRLGSDLQQALILLPTRRAVRNLADCFVDQLNQNTCNALVLPNMHPLADIDPHEPPFSLADLDLDIPPAISDAQRQFEFARLIYQLYKQIGAPSISMRATLALTDALIQVVDDADMEEVPPESHTALNDILASVPEHLQYAGLFYSILQTHWPDRLSELGFISAKKRQVCLLNALTRHWYDHPPDHPVIIAGSTGTLKATTRLIACVAQLPRGMIILPGLDQHISDKSWQKIGTQHPQNALKNLLEKTGISRTQVKNFTPSAKLHIWQDARRRVISESLMPVEATQDWPGRIAAIRKSTAGNIDPFEHATKGLSVIEARSDEEEALVIALILRDNLNHAERKAALVTPDPILARRVRAALRRWHIEINFSQGEPLEQTPIGSFISGLLRLAQTPQSPVDLAFTCKHTLNTLGQQPMHVRHIWQDFEKRYFHGIRPISAQLKTKDDIRTFLARIEHALTPLLSLEMASAPEWTKALIETAEQLADNGNLDETVRLWQGESGQHMAHLMSDLMAFGHILEPMRLADFTRILSELMRQIVVRPHYGTHPRLQILGPLEARMVIADTLILGGLNEGIWPSAPAQAPFLSRIMRESLGLSLPERRYGLSAHDFSELSTHADVILTRALNSQGTPTLASRWLWRLQTLVKGALGDAADKALQPNRPYLDWARALDHVERHELTPAQRPCPCPPLTTRWPNGRKMSVTRINVWSRDPYSIYCRNILKLKPLKPLDMPFGATERGLIMHKGLELFCNKKDSVPDTNGALELADIWFQLLCQAGYDENMAMAEQERLRLIAQQVCQWLTTRDQQGWQVHAIEKPHTLYLPEIDFTLNVQPDRIEENANNYAIIDFKTGIPPTPRKVQDRFNPQLPLSALVLGNKAICELIYIHLRPDPSGMETSLTGKPKLPTVQDYKAQAKADLIALVRLFDNPDCPYPSQPRLINTYTYSDYDHLARQDEWAHARQGTD